jgi:hypothetical protein
MPYPKANNGVGIQQVVYGKFGDRAAPMLPNANLQSMNWAYLIYMVHPRRFERLTSAFGD